MREFHNAGHKNILLGNACNFENYPTSKIIIDYGAKLRQLSWNKNCLYREVFNHSITYVMILVFVL